MLNFSPLFASGHIFAHIPQNHATQVPKDQIGYNFTIENSPSNVLLFNSV